MAGNLQLVFGGVAVGAAPVNIGSLESDGGAGEMVIQEHPEFAVGIADQLASAGIFTLKLLGIYKIRISKQ